MLVMVCGYKRMGKDTFYHNLTNGTAEAKYDFEYLNEDTKKYLKILFDGKSFTRIAFADILKEEVSRILSVDISSLKDSPINELHQKEGWVGSTYRDIMIEVANNNRKIDDLYYVKKVAEVLKDKIDDSIIVVTDWRFLCELKLGEMIGISNIITVRVHRDNVNIPPIEDTSEHQLDDFVADIKAICK